ncbi:MAG: hypothetical protein ACQESG_06850 [Nanobdellota archaeon]
MTLITTCTLKEEYQTLSSSVYGFAYAIGMEGKLGDLNVSLHETKLKRDPIDGEGRGYGWMQEARMTFSYDESR